MFGTIATYLGWAYVPNIATRQLLPYFHKAYQLALRRPPPAPNTKAYQTHYRLLYAAVVVSYLLYNFYEAALSMERNYYEILGVEPTADEGMLKTAFRQFARKHHPDRVGPSGEKLFMSVRDAYEALKSPVKRFAYDRSADVMLEPESCSSHSFVGLGPTLSSGHNVPRCGNM